jgi:hypothetical protein
VKERLAAPLPGDFDNDAVAQQLLQRAKLLQRHCVMAGQNLLIAQHRDTRRYAAVRSGLFKPKERRFEVGDFVYERRPSAEALHMRARPAIYRIKRISPAGVATLQGRCGSTVDVHLVHLAPCHLANIDPTIDVTLLQRPGADTACEVCRHTGDGDDMLLCDECNAGYHNFCLVPEVIGVPEGTWICPRCEAAGITIEEVDRRLAAAAPAVDDGSVEVDTGAAPAPLLEPPLPSSRLAAW